MGLVQRVRVLCGRFFGGDFYDWPEFTPLVPLDRPLAERPSPEGNVAIFEGLDADHFGSTGEIRFGYLFLPGPEQRYFDIFLRDRDAKEISNMAAYSFDRFADPFLLLTSTFYHPDRTVAFTLIREDHVGAVRRAGEIGRAHV